MTKKKPIRPLKYTPVVLNVDKEQWKQIKAIAKAEERTAVAHVRVIITEYLTNRGV